MWIVAIAIVGGILAAFFMEPFQDYIELHKARKHIYTNMVHKAEEKE